MLVRFLGFFIGCWWGTSFTLRILLPRYWSSSTSSWISPLYISSLLFQIRKAKVRQGKKGMATSAGSFSPLESLCLFLGLSPCVRVLPILRRRHPPRDLHCVVRPAAIAAAAFSAAADKSVTPPHASPQSPEWKAPCRPRLVSAPTASPCATVDSVSDQNPTPRNFIHQLGLFSLRGASLSYLSLSPLRWNRLEVF